MDFGTAADAYDLLCDPARLEREVPAIATLLGGSPGRVLDLACGLGDHLGTLLRHGAISGGTGIDLAEGMVGRARQRHPDARLAFRAQDLRTVEAGDHTHVLCLGNALACLDTPAQAYDWIARIRTRLGGRLIVQVANPARQGPEHATVVRRRDGLAVVKTVLRLDDGALLTLTVHRHGATGWTSASEHQRLIRLDAAGLRAAAPDGRLLGGLDGSPYDPATSADLILVASG